MLDNEVMGQVVCYSVPAQALMTPSELQPSIFWRPFLVVTLLNNNRSFHLHGVHYTAFHYQ